MLQGDVASPVRDGVDQAFLAQHLNRTSRRAACNLELRNQFALSRYPGIRWVLARRDTTSEYRRDLPVRGNRSNRINTVNAPISHIDNFSCVRLMSYAGSRLHATSCVGRQAHTGSRTLWRNRQGRSVAHRAPVPSAPAGTGGVVMPPLLRPRRRTPPVVTQQGASGLVRGRETPLQAAPVSELDTDYTPRYIRLARLLRGQIENGTYPPSSLLPSATRLAAAHAVSKATALHALEMLVDSGHARHVASKPHQVIWRPGASAAGSSL